MPFPAFSAGYFKEMNKQENAVVSCFFHFSLVLSIRYSFYEKKPNDAIRITE